MWRLRTTRTSAFKEMKKQKSNFFLKTTIAVLVLLAFFICAWFGKGFIFPTKSACVSESCSTKENPDVIIKYAVDLGLPSGILWADRNVGADSPEDYGDYFAWGETNPKSDYAWSTYKWRGNDNDTMTKYCVDNDCGMDNKNMLDIDDDAAYVNMGKDWRMPTAEEQKELSKKCTWLWTTQNGVKGYKVTGPNGNSIFLPAAGFREGSTLSNVGLSGSFWSSSLNEAISDIAWGLAFRSGGRSMGCTFRWNGVTVRAVVR